MAAVTICNGFGAPSQKKSDTVSTVSPYISHEVMGPDAMIFVSGFVYISFHIYNIFNVSVNIVS